MEKLREILIDGAKELGIELSEKQAKQFLTYLEILQDWNKRINLTSLKDPKEIIVTHFLDSLTVSKGIDEIDPIRVIGIGTGAGFPGIPLKILRPQISLSLLDSSRKRIEFLEYLSKSLKLKELEIIWGRAEEYGRKKRYRERYDIILARALARLNILVELGIPFLKIRGLFIAQKGQKLKEELEEARRAIEILGGELKGIISLRLPFSRKSRKLIIIEKILETSDRFPRRSGIPQKRPLK
ncbi:16S rRNA (guanine(527)-N(7))-methyltransferase RsmG [bacterium]|nr:16S rRNA (guanine(527)-N(7))-methyltransferase RsmG [bacterium]MCG2677909.1 16S rRNA (guanine(527)-N(7))-methyltransferase RsmG [bacterium]